MRKIFLAVFPDTNPRLHMISGIKKGKKRISLKDN